MGLPYRWITTIAGIANFQTNLNKRTSESLRRSSRLSARCRTPNETVTAGNTVPSEALLSTSDKVKLSNRFSALAESTDGSPLSPAEAVPGAVKPRSKARANRLSIDPVSQTQPNQSKSSNQPSGAHRGSVADSMSASRHLAHNEPCVLEKDSRVQRKSQRSDGDTSRSASQAWSETEKAVLRNLVIEYQEQNPGRTVKWDPILNEWNQRRSEGQELKLRTASGLSSHYNKVLKQETGRSSTAPAEVKTPKAPVHVTVPMDDSIGAECPSESNVEMAPTEGSQTPEDCGQPEHQDGPAQADQPVPLNEEPVTTEGASAPDDRDRPKDNRDPGDPVPSGDSLQDCPYEEFKRKFYKNFNEAYKCHVRKALRKPRRLIPKLLVEWSNHLLYEGMYKGPYEIDRLSALVYAAGRTICWFMEREYQLMNKENLSGNRYDLKDKIRKLEEEINSLDREIKRRNKRKPLDTNARLIFTRYKGKNKAQLKVIMHDLAAKLSMMLRRQTVNETERDRRYLRKQTPKYALAEKEENNTPIDATRNYWEDIIGHEHEFATTPELREWADSIREKQAQVEIQELGVGDHYSLFKEVYQKARPWKAPGPDGIQNFWWKYIPAAKELLWEWIMSVHRGETKPQKWISSGRIVLLHKGGNPDEPGNYRPIACLNTCYKFLTGMLARWIQRYVEAYDVLPKEQVALRKKVWGCSHAHLLDRAITFDAHLRGKKPLSMAWVDFRKAFDSVKHKYIKWAIKQIGLPESMRVLLGKLMSNWVVHYEGRKNGRKVTSRPVEVKNGVLQGDTLSPLLFCLAITPISHQLTSSVRAYETSFGKIKGHSVKLGHLYYMDDLKIYTNGPGDLNRALRYVETIGKSIGLEINAQKCATIHLNQRNTQAERGEALGNIPTIGLNQSYKYLGITQNKQLDQDQLLSNMSKAVLDKASQIWSSNLTFGQMIMNTNSQVMSKAAYVFGNLIVGRGKLESTIKFARKLDLKLRNILHQNDAKYSKATSQQRLYVDRARGGFGLQTFAETLERATVYTWCYLATKPELANVWQIFHSNAERGKRSVITDFRAILNMNIYVQENLKDRIHREPDRPVVVIDNVEYREATVAARAISKLLHDARQSVYYGKWESRILQGRVLRNADLDTERSLRWMTKGHVGKRVMKIATACQEGMLVTNAFKKKYYRSSNGLCRMRCHVGTGSRPQVENTQHIVSMCRHWRTGLMVERHDAVARQIHWYLCRKYELGTYHYTKKPMAIKENGLATLFWDHNILTERQLQHNRPDIVLVDHKSKSIAIVEVRVSGPTSILNEERRKYIKYAVNSNLPEEFDIRQRAPAGDNLLREMQKRYNGYSAKVIPLVVGVNGEISKNTFGYLREMGIPDDDAERLIDRMARSAAIGTYRIVLAHTANPAGASEAPGLAFSQTACLRVG